MFDEQGLVCFKKKVVTLAAVKLLFDLLRDRDSCKGRFLRSLHRLLVSELKIQLCRKKRGLLSVEMRSDG